jgi:hypothetical protein
MEKDLLSRLSAIKAKWAFLLLWAVTFAIYIATAPGGWVIDAIGWIYDMKHHSFIDFLNRTQSSSESFYQLFALHYYVFYKLWGLNPVMWALLYITLHAINALLVFVVARSILSDSDLKNGTLISLAAALIFTVCPHISEVLIWKACYHYLQSFMYVLLTMLFVVRYQRSQQSKYMWGTIIVFALAAFTLEIFYLLPFFVLSLAFYYRFALGYDKHIFRSTLLKFFLPQLLMLALYFAGIFAVYKFIRPHKTEISESTIDYLGKLPKYLFNVIFLGRYFSIPAKTAVYSFLSSPPAIAVFYSLLAGICIYVAVRLKTLRNDTKLMFLLLSWVILLLAFLTPLAFPEKVLLVFYDRYTYFADAFIYLLLIIIISRFISNKYVLIGLFCIYVDVNLYCTIRVNTYWMNAAKIDNGLLHHFPDPGNKTVLLLNIPENMWGAPMIGAQPDGMFKIMKETISDTLIKNNIYDVASYNMTNDYDGANVTVKNDSVIRVTLNHTGNWWWYEGHGARSYETPDYSVNMKDPGRWYEITLKHPADRYMLLYSVGDKWKTADMSKVNVQQD